MGNDTSTFTRGRAGRLLLSAILVLIVSAGVIVGFHLSTTERYLPRGGSVHPQLAEEDFAGLLQTGHRIGSETAPVQVLVYHDYRCGFSRELVHVMDNLIHTYPQHLAVVYKHFVDRESPSGRQYLVPLGAGCASEQGAFEAYHRAATRNAPLGYADAASILANEAGIPDLAAFRDCLAARRYAGGVRSHYEEGRRLRVTVTPTLFLNGLRIEGLLPPEVLDSLVVSEFPRRVW